MSNENESEDSIESLQEMFEAKKPVGKGKLSKQATINRKESPIEKSSRPKSSASKSSKQSSTPVIVVPSSAGEKVEKDNGQNSKDFEYYLKKIVNFFTTSLNIVIALSTRVVFSLHILVAIVYVYLIKQDTVYVIYLRFT